jgi:hypothetical protein
VATVASSGAPIWAYLACSECASCFHAAPRALPTSANLRGLPLSFHLILSRSALQKRINGFSSFGAAPPRSPSPSSRPEYVGLLPSAKTPAKERLARHLRFCHASQCKSPASTTLEIVSNCRQSRTCRHTVFCACHQEVRSSARLQVSVSTLPHWLLVYYNAILASGLLQS